MILSILAWAFPIALSLAWLYLCRLNYLLNETPEVMRKLVGPKWTETELKETYQRLKDHPVDYTDQLPPKLDRRYVVTGGSGKYCLLFGTLGSRRET
jgi:hypothetical protein